MIFINPASQQCAILVALIDRFHEKLCFFRVITAADAGYS